MIIDGFKLMVIGMGYVLLFLSIMVVVILLVAKALKPFAHLLEEKTAPPRRTPAPAADNKNLVAAAIAAVHMHRNKK
ncbi:MAG: OadG family protein [Victivallales bacterium]|jgi:oxaloacetate decarboxylase gamma subunit